MPKNTQNNPVVRRNELGALTTEIAGALVELDRRTTRLAEVLASIALVLREEGLIKVEDEEPEAPLESDTDECCGGHRVGRGDCGGDCVVIDAPSA